MGSHYSVNPNQSAMKLIQRIGLMYRKDYKQNKADFVEVKMVHNTYLYFSVIFLELIPCAWYNG